jgi:hypothetical protein
LRAGRLSALRLKACVFIGLAVHALIYILLIFKFDPFDLYRGACGGGSLLMFSRELLLLPQRASLKRASKAADPNFVLRVEIKIFYLAHCMTVLVNFDCGAARSGIRQIGNVIIFHLWSSFMESHSWLKA